MSEEQVAWIAAFTKARKEFPVIGKGTTVNAGTYSYTYATLPDIIEKVRHVLQGNGLVVVQDVTGDGGVVAVETRIYHKAGHVETFGPLALRVQGDAKAAGSAITYARRYALCAALGIAPDEDDDGTTASTPARVNETPTAAWGDLWERMKIFKDWSGQERNERVLAAMKYLGIEEIIEHDHAERIFTHLSSEYQKRPTEGQAKLEVET